MDVYILFSGSKRVTMRPEDMSIDKISVIFQVQKESLYLTDDSNVALFPRPDGLFNSFELNERGHYEVHGDSTTVDKSPGAFQAGQPVRFSFHRPPSAAASSSCSMPRSTLTKTFVRNVFYAEVLDGKLETSKMVTVRFTEFEACVATVTSKVKEALGQLESVILTDSHGNEILDSEGTRGSAYWKQNSRKVFAVPEEQRDLLQVNKRRRLSRKEDTGLQEVAAYIEDVVEAAQGLQDVSRMIRDLTGSAQSTLTTVLSLSEAEVASMKAAFCCVVCKGPFDKPMFATCCRSLIGCEVCILEWMKGSSHCPKCRAVNLEDGIHKVAGLCEALAPLGNLLL